MDLNTATSVIDRDFTSFDTAHQNDAGKADGKIGEDDLRAVAENRGDRFSEEQQAAAQYLLDSRASYAMLDVGREIRPVPTQSRAMAVGKEVRARLVSARWVAERSEAERTRGLAWQLVDLERERDWGRGR